MKYLPDTNKLLRSACSSASLSLFFWYHIFIMGKVCAHI